MSLELLDDACVTALQLLRQRLVMVALVPEVHPLFLPLQPRFAFAVDILLLAQISRGAAKIKHTFKMQSDVLADGADLDFAKAFVSLSALAES